MLMHATGFLPWLWHPIAKALAPDFTVIAPYFCDHRESDHRNGGLRWALLAEDFYALCRKLEINNPCLAGHSMGATVITLAEALHGPFAKKMIAIEPIYLPEQIYSMNLTVEQHPLASKSIKRKNYWDDRETAREYLSSKAIFKKWDSEMLDLYIKYGMMPGDNGGLKLTCSPEREASLFMGGCHYNPWPLLSAIRCPLLILEGETSENRAFIDLKKAASLAQQGTYKLIPDSGHLIPMEKPGEIIRIFKNFLSE
jgi:pimeloyl-ACP methyl ester carboxylesterase